MESKKKDKYVNITRESKKLWNINVKKYTNRDRCFWYSHQRINKRTGGLGGRRTSGDHPNYYIIENGQNTGNTPGDLRKLALTQTPVKNHQLKLI